MRDIDPRPSLFCAACPPARPARAALILLALLVAAALAACSEGAHEPRTRRAPVALPIHALADSARVDRLDVRPPGDVHVWLSRVSREPPPAIEPQAAGGALLTPQLPSAEPDSVIPQPAPAALEVDRNLKPPILRVPADVRLPATARRVGSVELDVRVAEDGSVSDARWAGGEGDTALVRAASEAARGMRFYPALQGGRPVAVWCRQRFDFSAAR